MPPLTRIWSWGAGTHGQLASGDFDDHLVPLLSTSFAAASVSSMDACPNVLDMAGGGAHVVAVLGSEGPHSVKLGQGARLVYSFVCYRNPGHGQVVSWGKGQSGSLGQGDESDLNVPKLVNFFQGIQIRSVAAGWSHTAFLSNSEELYTCGSGAFGQLGHGDFKSCLTPSKVETLPSKAVSMVVCGLRHTVVLARGTSGEQEVYGFGSCKRGQLGVGALDHTKTSQTNLKRTAAMVSVPERISGLKEHRIVLLAANGDHSAALSENGSLYLWGRGFNGSPDDFVPVQVGSQLQFSTLALGWSHGIALADGQLWAWGSNDRGQLGVPNGSVSESTSFSNGHSPKGMDSVSAAVPAKSPASGTHGPEMIMVGGLEGNVVRWLSAGAEHSAVVLDDGKIMLWGWGEHGQLGLGTVEDQLCPEMVSIPLGECLKCRTFCGSGFTFAVTEQSLKI